MSKDKGLKDLDLFEDDIDWTMIRTKDLCRITMVAKADTPINALKLYLSLDAQLERWRVELGVMEPARELQ